MRLVLDSWPIAEWLKRKPAAVRVRQMLQQAARGEHTLLMNVINVGELLYVSARYRNLDFAERFVASLRDRLTIVPATDEIVFSAARLKARYAIAYADAFAMATALIQDVPLVTGDPEIRDAAVKEKSLSVRWIGT